MIAARLADLPYIVVLMGLGALAMMGPAFFGVVVGEYAPARSFFYAGLLFLVLFAMIAVATSTWDIRREGRSHLSALIATFTLLPAMLAVPFYDALGTTPFLSAWFEMVSSLTTTGATLYEPERLPRTLHLWRAAVGWLGGYFVWVTAAAVLTPLNLGGFEVRSSAPVGQGAARVVQITRVADMSERLKRYGMQFLPVYGGLTAVLWAALTITGESPFVAACHAMSVLATSGISPVGGATGAGFAGEALMVLFMVFAFSRVLFAADDRPEGLRSIREDPELRLAGVILAALPLLLFARHYVGALEIEGERDLPAAAEAYWGGLFTAASFLSTTGFVSATWDSARLWSGLEAPGLILMGLAVFGGGVGTAAGGVKLLRVYALYRHGLREIERLVHPSSIGGGGGAVGRQLRRHGARVAWIFFMLFAMSIALVMAALSLTGLDFEESLVLAIAALSTTGPLTEVAGAEPFRLDLLSEPAKVVMAFAMVVGRLETLAIIALLNPDFWRS